MFCSPKIQILTHDTSTEGNSIIQTVARALNKNENCLYLPDTIIFIRMNLNGFDNVSLKKNLAMKQQIIMMIELKQEANKDYKAS